MKLNILTISLLLISWVSFSQSLSWELSENGTGVSNHQELIALDFSFGTGLTSPKFSSSGAYTKGWSQDGLNEDDYFQVGIVSTALDTFEIAQLEYSERRSNTGIRDYEIRYATKPDFSNYESLGLVNVPDNDKERDTLMQDLGVLLLPQDTLYIRWYGYHSESGAGSWRMNNGALKVTFRQYVKDVTTPELITALATDSKHIEMLFDESLKPEAFDIDDFTLNGTVHPINIDKQMCPQGKFILEFDSDFPLEEAMSLRYKNISDKAGNSITEEQEVEVFYYQPNSFCVLIDELMPDPTPVVYLPESEYIELYNTKSFPVSLKNWTLKINSYQYTFGDVSIQGESYLLLVPQGKSDLFPDTLAKYELFTNNKLTNSGAKLVLLDNTGKWIHQVNYTEDWYTESYKKDGGWSLEMKDFNQPCNMQTNWAASVSNTGGTPGQINSIHQTLSEGADLEVVHSYFSDSTCVILFNQNLSPEYTPDKLKFTLNNQTADSAWYSIGNLYLELQFSQKPEANQVYQLTIEDEIFNCSSEILNTPIDIRMGVPSSVGADDLVINEIFFNPKGKHSKYIELYNRSNKVIDLQELKFGIQKDTSISYKLVMFDYPVLIFPKDYLVLTKNKSDVEQQFYVKHPEQLFTTEEFPNISTTEGTLILANKGNLTIDKVIYSEDFHSTILYDKEGIALERINPNISGLQASAWKSASESSGFGTPTYQNSQYSDLNAQLSSRFELESETFSPDMDGYQDYMLLNYELEKSGYQAEVKVYDAKGRLVKELVNNEYTGMKGYWTWDGKNDEGQTQALGIYILLIELTHPDGETIQEKKVCTLAGRLK